MSQPPNLLNDDGVASMATMLMLSHHAFRRDILRFIRAVEQIKSGDHSRVEDIRNEWTTSYRKALHGHHIAEDTRIFPDIKNNNPEISSTIDQLMEQHHKIDSLLERGDEAFANLYDPDNALDVLMELKQLLDKHLEFEEANITPVLRSQTTFPPMPEDENTIAMFAEGFAWSMQGISPIVIEEVKKLLPEALLNKLPEAQKKFEERCKRVWGEYSLGSSLTPVP